MLVDGSREDREARGPLRFTAGALGQGWFEQTYVGQRVPDRTQDCERRSPIWLMELQVLHRRNSRRNGRADCNQNALEITKRWFRRLG